MKIGDKRVIKGLFTDCLGLCGTIKCFISFLWGVGGRSRNMRHWCLPIGFNESLLLLFSLCPDFLSKEKVPRNGFLAHASLAP